MKVKIALLDNDLNYLSRIVSVFNTKYADKLATYSFTDREKALECVEQSKIDVFIASDSFEINPEDLPKRCGFAYFVDATNVDEYKEQRAIGKFQKAELIYKQILSVYAEKASLYSGGKNTNSNTKILMVTSFSGGVGASSVAAAVAMRAANANKKVMYINLEKMGNSEVFFDGEGQFTFSDVIYAIKGKKSNLGIKIESSVKTSKEGVSYFAAANMSLDMMELKTEDIEVLLDTVLNLGGYEYVVVDVDYVLDDIGKMLWERADNVVVVSDGSEIANSKFERTYRSLEVLNQRNEEDYVLEKATIMYNKFSNKTSKTVEGIEISEVGGAPRYDHAMTTDVVKQLSAINSLDKLM